MPSSEIIALNLQPRLPGGNQSIWLRALVARTLAVIQDLIAAESEPEDAPLLADLQQISGEYALDTEAPPLAEAEASCLQRSGAVADRTRQRREERRREMVAILALVQDAVSAASTEVMSIHSDIDVSGDRFEAIAKLEDPKQVKALLKAQVSLLKQMAAVRRASWEARQLMFAKKVEDLQQQLEATRNEAALDPLTGVGNHGAFHRECRARAERAGARFVLAILDVDDFKRVNDSYGHAVGDRVLLKLARGLRQRLRDGDFIGRIGGDEFAVLINNLTLRQAEARFGSVLDAVFVTPDDGGDSLPCVPTISCGLAEFSAGDTYDSLYERADQALYAAKHAGKRRVVVKERPFLRDLMRK